MPLVVDLADETPNARAARLFDAHHDRLYRLARRLTASPEEARDLVQDTFLKVVRAPRLVPIGAASEEAWLVRVLVNACRDQWRRGATRRRYRDQHADEPAHARTDAPEASFIARDSIWRALQQLSPRRRAIVVLHELDELGVRDIAQLIGVTAVTVRWHLSRGRRELATILERLEGPTT